MSYTSKKYNTFNDIKHKSNEDICVEYGIEIDENDGSVFDPTEGKSFNSLKDWATYVDEIYENDNGESFLKFGGKQCFDDEYNGW